MAEIFFAKEMPLLPVRQKRRPENELCPQLLMTRKGSILQYLIIEITTSNGLFLEFLFTGSSAT
jgi:hypothetical protein